MTEIVRGNVAVSKGSGSLTSTGNSLADVETFPVSLLRTKHLTFSATTNTMVAKVLGSYDDGLTFPATVEAEFDVTTAAQVVKSNTDFYTHLKVQTKPKVGGAHGTLAVILMGASY